MEPRSPALYQVNTRAWLTARGRALGRPASLDDIGDDDLDGWAAAGFDWIWLLSVWRISEAGRRIARSDPDLRRTFEAELPDLVDADIGGSGFAVTGYVVNPDLGGDAALARLRTRMTERGLRLMLDFVPNHTALDHPWVVDHEAYYVHGTEADLERAPGNYVRIHRDGADDVILAHGRDPYFAGWTDTLQLDYSNRATVGAMSDELLGVAARCDGVRCDMSMLLLPDVFERTWGRPARPFWAEAIGRVRREHPSFRFLAEVYWGLEWTMQGLGFDDAYDKRLYDRLVGGAAGPVREHLGAGLDYQSRLARFLENHDEPRAAATFRPEQHRAASLVTYLTPGLRFFQDGQLEGRRVHLSPHLVRAPDEPPDPDLSPWYGWLLGLLRKPVFRDGDWRLLDREPAWDGNASVDQLIAFSWATPAERWIVVVNYGGGAAQGFVRLPFDDLVERSWRLVDRTTDVTYDRAGDDLVRRGLYVDLGPWRSHVLGLLPGPSAG